MNEKGIIPTIIMSAGVLISAYLLPPKVAEASDYFSLETSNNLDIEGKTPENGDNGITGSIKLDLSISDYQFGAELTAITQKYPKLIQKLGAPRRIDVLELSSSKKIKTYRSKNHKFTLYAGGQLIVSGNFGGESIQNFIHSGNGSDQVDVPYSSDTPYAFGFQIRFEGVHKVDEYFNAYSNGKIKLNTDGSGEIGGEIGIQKEYDRLMLKIGLGAKYISPFDQNLVEVSTPDHNVQYTLAEVQFNVGKHADIILSTKVEGGDNPNGSGKVEPYTNLGIKYEF